ncbi:hypothetical protein [Pseudonocardia phyllosphaerae]
MSLTFIIFLLFLGGVLGFFAGQKSAEDGRARSDMRKTWNGRKGYRK